MAILGPKTDEGSLTVVGCAQCI